MNHKILLILFILIPFLNSHAQESGNNLLREEFRNPPFEYRAIFPFQGACGTKYYENTSIRTQLDKIYNHYGFGGIIVSPTTAKPFTSALNPSTPGYMKHVGNGLQANLPAGASPWLMTLPAGTVPYNYQSSEDEQKSFESAPLPEYLSKDYFDQLRDILAYSNEKGRKVIWYDEVGYPSGIANYTTPQKYYRKLLEKTEEIIKGPKEINKIIPEEGELMAVVAMKVFTHERIDLTPMVKNNSISWKVPEGDWKLMTFKCVTAKANGTELDYRVATDYLDPEAVNWFINKVYEPHVREVGNYFGNTLFQTFYDDVGFFDEERTWTTQFNGKFRERFGLNPAIYYPALWEDIGSETNAARIAFFDTRSELLADGFPKLVTDWGNRNNIEVSGHCPGNYDPQPVDMNGDPFKFYRSQPIPMVDVIFAYPTGRDGFKLISDGADFYDKPVVAAETFSAFSPAGETAGYRRLMELYIRGINRLMGSGLPKYNASGENTAFAEWVGRHSMMLQGGQRISEIAIFYPIADLQAFYRFDAPEYTKEMRWGTFVPYHNDFLAIGEMLLGEVHRDFTFLHPDFLLSDKLKINGPELKLENKVNSQTYKVLILPGQKVISLKALDKIKAYYDQGGIVIATSLLPSEASEFTGNESKTAENNLKVRQIIKEMFGIDPSKPMPQGVSCVKSTRKIGKAVFINKPDSKLLIETFNNLKMNADVTFSENPLPSSGGGMFSYIHKKRGKCDIYFFANSSNDVVETITEVRGKIRPELWDPSTGAVTKMDEVTYLTKNGHPYTRFPLKLKAVSSIFVVSEI